MFEYSVEESVHMSPTVSVSLIPVCSWSDLSLCFAGRFYSKGRVHGGPGFDRARTVWRLHAFPGVKISRVRLMKPLGREEEWPKFRDGWGHP